jgi:NACalpha-BTF3-like transcription factor
VVVVVRRIQRTPIMNPTKLKKKMKRMGVMVVDRSRWRLSRNGTSLINVSELVMEADPRRS